MFYKCLVFTCLMVCVSAFGQIDSIFNEKTKALQELFSERNYEAVQFSDTSIHIIKSISLANRDIENTSNSNYLEKQKELLQRDNGLSLIGSYLENFNPDIADLNDNLVYARKFQAGINWSILKNGFF